MTKFLFMFAESSGLNELGKVDKAFFIICAAIIAAIIAVYFLIPVFNRKMYREQRENLKKREEAFKSNLRTSQAAHKPAEAPAEEPAKESADKSDE